MLLVYRMTTGEVVENTGINSAFPDGVPDEFAYLNTDAQGIDRGELALLRLNDHEDAVLVAGVLARGCTVKDGAVVLADAPPAPDPEPAPTAESLSARLTAAQASIDAQQAALDELKAATAALASA